MCGKDKISRYNPLVSLCYCNYHQTKVQIINSVFNADAIALQQFSFKFNKLLKNQWLVAGVKNTGMETGQ